VGTPELSGERTVGTDGRLTMPVVGGIKVVDLSPMRPRGDHRGGVTRMTPMPRPRSLITTTPPIGFWCSDACEARGLPSTHVTPIRASTSTAPDSLDAIALPGVCDRRNRRGQGGADRCAVFRGGTASSGIDLKALLTGANLAVQRFAYSATSVVYLPDADRP